MSQLIASTVLLAIAIILTEVRRLGVGWDILKGAVRSFIQLMAVGFVIKFIFGLEQVQYQILLLLVMVVVAAYTARGRVKSMPGAFRISFISILAGASATLGVMLALDIIDASPNYLIPLGGMIIGNAMNALSLGFERIGSEVKQRRGEIETALCLGASPQKAIEPLVRRSVKASFIPMLNLMKIVGIVQMPGAMTGMLLAGADPLDAVRIQLVVIYMLVASTSITMLMGTAFTYRSFFNRNWQLMG
ncbi:MAG: iron export ABC transporter permease subunit FetB [bacterium]|jgi:putative ABC transport system permease protein